jgi:hypothetical protein
MVESGGCVRGSMGHFLEVVCHSHVGSAGGPLELGTWSLVACYALPRIRFVVALVVLVQHLNIYYIVCITCTVVHE